LPVHTAIDWICISPKAGSQVVQTSGDELKLVWPQPGAGHDMDDIMAMEGWIFAHRLLQPLDDLNARENAQACVDFVLARPNWRLTVQAHKYLGLR
jgi:organic radical activating enzyme